MNPKQLGRNRPSRLALLATGVFSLLSAVVCADAQETTKPDHSRAAGAPRSERLSDAAMLRHTTLTDFRESYRFRTGSAGLPNSPAFGMPLESRRPGVTRPQPAQAGRERSTRRKVLGAIAGGVGGFFGGMFLGAAIEGDRCDCDDPGLVGALIGAPIGGAVGGILGYRFLF
jgi:hypothetical protein